MADNPIALAAVRRSNQVYFEQVSQRETLDCGYAYFNCDFPRLAGCNFIGEVVLDPGGSDAYETVEQFYAVRGLTCHAWAPAAQQAVEPLAQLLEPRGFRRSEQVALLLRPGAELGVDEHVRMLSARAMRRAYTGLIQQRADEQAQPSEFTALHIERLNNPQYDAFVAFVDQRPVGTLALFQVGEIGRICDIFVPPQDRRGGVATAMLGYAIMTARRWSLRPICAAVAVDDPAGRALLARAGFEEGGAIVSFVRDSV